MMVKQVSTVYPQQEGPMSQPVHGPSLFSLSALGSPAIKIVLG